MSGCRDFETELARLEAIIIVQGQEMGLVGEMLEALDLDQVEDSVQRQGLVERWVGLLDGDNLAPVARASVGRALAVLGDPRPGVGVDAETGLPDVAWCEVPAGPFLMGSSDDDALAYDDEKPQHEQAVAYDYRIARYPVTNAQFDVFVTAGGYAEPRYWPEAEAAGTWQGGRVVISRDEKPRDRPVDPGEPYNLPNHPVVNVSWYEALAFCRWLTERFTVCDSRLMIDNLILKSEIENQEWVVRLPTETEWEKAARGMDARDFPWGNEPDPKRANYADARIGATSAVGCFPGGASPYGLFDMSGNVEEWCQTVWLDNYEGYGQKVSQSTRDEGLRVLRGGAFGYDARVVRCACRYRYEPSNWNHDVGFRVCFAPGLTLAD